MVKYNGYNYKMCIKCGIRSIGKPIKDWDKDVCWICFLKSKGFYSSAIKEVGGWYDWHTNLLKYETGWSFINNINWFGLFTAILKMGSLNKTPKTKQCIEDKFSKWQLDTYKNYGNKSHAVVGFNKDGTMIGMENED